tara:strand:+ start:470 stop:664 length:195 start_codon:yes stop_codon:yes gene_type:complete
MVLPTGEQHSWVEQVTGGLHGGEVAVLDLQGEAAEELSDGAVKAPGERVLDLGTDLVGTTLIHR